MLNKLQSLYHTISNLAHGSSPLDCLTDTSDIFCVHIQASRAPLRHLQDRWHIFALKVPLLPLD